MLIQWGQVYYTRVPWLYLNEPKKIPLWNNLTVVLGQIFNFKLGCFTAKCSTSFILRPDTAQGTMKSLALPVDNRVIVAASFNRVSFQTEASSDEESEAESVDLSWLPDPNKIYKEGDNDGGDVDDDDDGRESSEEDGGESSEDEK